MRAIGFPVVKNAGSLELGELCIFRTGKGESVVAICVGRYDDQAVLGELREAGECILRSIPSGRPCASYGSDWVVETAFAPDRSPMQTNEALAAAFVFVATDGVLLKLTDPEYGTPTPFRLNPVERLSGWPEYLIPITSFRIWASEREMQTPGATPVYASAAPAPPGVDVGAMIG